MQDDITQVFAIVCIRHFVRQNFPVDTQRRLTILVPAIARWKMPDRIAGKSQFNGANLKTNFLSALMP